MNRDKLVGVAVAVVAVLLLFGMAGTCHNSGPDVNQELAEATRVAVEAAREARAENDAAYMLPGRNRLLAVAIGVAVPTAAVVVVLYLSLRHRPEALEVDAEEDRQRQLTGMEPRASLARPRDILPVTTRQPESPGLAEYAPSESGSDQEASPASSAPPPTGRSG
ncbi:MAG: hypothetical protein WCK05_12495 [Planctomycetota bacterium]